MKSSEEIISRGVYGPGSSNGSVYFSISALTKLLGMVQSALLWLAISEVMSLA